MRVIIAGGGTGGHLFPALAVARAVRAEAPETEVLFVGARQGLEAKIIPSTEFPIRFITARGMRGVKATNVLRAILEIPRGIVESLFILRDFRPHVALGVGGYASGPTMLAALAMRIPTAIQEQNSVMGATNRALARLVDRVFISWEKTEPQPPQGKTKLTGNPIRGDLTAPAQAEPEREGLHVLVFGGSQGALSINAAITNSLDQLKPLADRISFVHQTGRGRVEETLRAYSDAGIHADVVEFIDDMGAAYHWADLVVCRAGASSLAEITALGKAAIVVPYPHAVGDHQTRNAEVLAARGAVRVIPDSRLRNGALVQEITELAENPEQLVKMAANSRKLGRPQAARSIARELLSMAGSHA
ncbi:MAG: undecaprenyldiphospho-muramoylpentapeptide beta-N-acetylglucosaminyltransferase [Deltaproteobacteria bacterium]|nr:undecaprenyldiphospho-muramoylpentapeptide beta-N-acetylglucosaminyltransferase [Deltaproteobacteria bacterium]